MNASDTAATTITVTANGEERQLPSDATVITLLGMMDLAPDTQGIAVAVDDSVVPRSEWNETFLSEGVRIEVISATQGG